MCEHWTGREEIVERQIETGAIYGTALNQNTFGYKIELCRQRRPDIIAIGSSRVLLVREEFFNTTFVNAGGVMNHLSEGVLFVNQIAKDGLPPLVILGADIWWFNDAYPLPTSYGYHATTGDSLNARKFCSTARYLASGKIDIRTLKYTMANELIANPLTGHDSLGFNAITYGDGFRPDGSYLYSSTFYGAKPSRDVEFGETLSCVDAGRKRFRHGQTTSGHRKDMFLQLIRTLREGGSHVVVFFPPFAPRVFDRIDGMDHEYLYVDKLKAWLTTEGVVFHDYSDAAPLGATECEFLDGFHGGDVVYQRILLDLSTRDAVLSASLNHELMVESIARYAGRTFSPLVDEERINREVDYLSLGCQK